MLGLSSLIQNDVNFIMLIVIIQSNKLKVHHWLIRILHLGCFYVGKLHKHNINFCINEFERKITKENNRCTPHKHNITRCCASVK